MAICPQIIWMHLSGGNHTSSYWIFINLWLDAILEMGKLQIFGQIFGNIIAFIKNFLIS
jgi:hypothetical protein